MRKQNYKSDVRYHLEGQELRRYVIEYASIYNTCDDWDHFLNS